MACSLVTFPHRCLIKGRDEGNNHPVSSAHFTYQTILQKGTSFTLYGIELVSAYGYATGHFKGRNASKMLYIGQASVGVPGSTVFCVILCGCSFKRLYSLSDPVAQLLLAYRYRKVKASIGLNSFILRLLGNLLV